MKFKRYASFICLIVLLASTLASCSSSQDTFNGIDDPTSVSTYSVTVSDYSGNSYVLQKAPEGIYVSSPSAAETLIALGSARLIRSCSAECKDLKGIPSTTSVRSTSFIAPQMLKDLGVDTVLFSSEDKAVNAEEYKEAGLKVFVFLEKGKISTAESNIRLAGAITFKTDLAEEIIKEIRNDIDVIRSISENKASKRTVYLECGSPDSFLAYTDNSLAGELLSIAGGENIFTAQDDTVTADIEVIKEKDPDVIISFINDESYTAKIIRKREGLENISACKTGLVYIYDETFPAVRPAPSVSDALYEIAKLIGTVKK